MLFQRDVIKEVVAAETAQKATQKEKSVAALKLKWGTNGAPCSQEVFDSKAEKSRGIADQLGIYQTLEAKGLASDPDIIGMLAVSYTHLTLPTTPYV